MPEMNFREAVERAVQIRKSYHQLEKRYHGQEWTVTEDALAFLTDAGLVGRLVMAEQGRWPDGGATTIELEHKLGECLWWLIVLAERMQLDSCQALQNFLTKTEQQLRE